MLKNVAMSCQQVCSSHYISTMLSDKFLCCCWQPNQHHIKVHVYTDHCTLHYPQNQFQCPNCRGHPNHASTKSKIQQSHGMSTHQSYKACPQEIQMAGHCQLMQICISSKISLSWDDSSDSFYSESDSKDTIDSDQITPTKPMPVHPGIPTITNLYNPLQPPPICPTILNTLQSWVLPNIPPQPPQQPPDPEKIPMRVTIETKGNTGTHNPNPPSHFLETNLLTQTDNHHCGHQMTAKTTKYLQVII